MSLDKYRKALEKAEQIEALMNGFDDELDCFDGRTIARVRSSRREWEQVVYYLRKEVHEVESSRLHSANRVIEPTSQKGIKPTSSNAERQRPAGAVSEVP